MARETRGMLRLVLIGCLGVFSSAVSLPRFSSPAFAPTAAPLTFLLSKPAAGISMRPARPAASSCLAPERTRPATLFASSFAPPCDPNGPLAPPSPLRDGRAGALSATMMDTALPKVGRRSSVGHKVLVLNASFEPLSVVSASRALSLLWEEKVMTIVPHTKTWTSCSGFEVGLPSVVCLRRYVKVRQKYPVVNRRTVLMRDKGICQYCGCLAENVDHVVPRSRGGKNNWENVVASCAPCNNRKADKMLKDTDMKLKKEPTRPDKESWVHAAVYKVDPRWFPYIGDSSWASIEKMWKGTKIEKKQRRSTASAKPKRTKLEKKREKRDRLKKASEARKAALEVQSSPEKDAEIAISMYSPQNGDKASSEE
uniref:HNH nuclease domain-containing protein n=1 Tax=Hemiselmis tepida TaxID=464990 RepID=A0A7S0VRL5_9CRYP|mmetsp:Transcript_25250/g.64003  ORF Transcript_25250/g.64003 Transcript_25250/m.64003 type:complete len:369 (+) Transcript_25250:196-1302(+)